MWKDLVILVVVACLFGSVACGIHTAPFRDPHGQPIPGSVAVMEDHTIGGVTQRLWFRAVNTAAPAVILVHGGPGATEAPLFRHFNAELEHHFLMVYWEQRGTGRSYRSGIPPESMTIEQFTRDLDEVVDLVCQRLHKQRVILLGHSWGSAIGILYAARFPDKVSAFVGIGQVADMREGERLSYEFAHAEAARRKNRDAMKALERIGPPIIFFLGRYGWQIPAVVASRYFDRIEAPYKQLVWFEESAHDPPFEEPDVFDRALVTVLTPILNGE